MRGRAWGTAVVAGVLAAGLVSAPVAVAQPSEPVVITLSPEQVQNMCSKRLPKAQQRVEKLLERINAGADVRGSVAWLKARAEKEKAAGRETTANLLEERAERRAGRVDDLNKVKTRVTDFLAKHCGAK